LQALLYRALPAPFVYSALFITLLEMPDPAGFERGVPPAVQIRLVVVMS